MNRQLRDYFDLQIETVLAGMPDQVHRLLDQVPMVVEDYPSDAVRRKTGIGDRRQLCGLYTGIPLSRRSVEHSGILSDVVYLFREGILSLAVADDGQIDESELRVQIQITILHELGHHHGMSEADLSDLGY